MLNDLKGEFRMDELALADLEGVWVVHLNPPSEPNYFNFMGNFMKNQVKC